MWRDWTTLPPLRRGLLTSRLREYQARVAMERGWEAKADMLRQSTGGDVDVVISLTSHAPRFATLAPTLRSLLLQDLRPTAVILWIAHRDIAALPDEVLGLREFGLTIEACDDHGPHTKYAHALRRLAGTGTGIATASCRECEIYRPCPGYRKRTKH